MHDRGTSVRRLVRKLQLKIDHRPKPYKLSWLKKGSEVTVDKRCLVSFSIGKKYFDNAWSNVVSMDACHLLLGRLISAECDTFKTLNLHMLSS
jgi:hypothetical protein